MRDVSVILGVPAFDFAGKFRDNWLTRTLQTDLEPMKKVARMLRRHKPLVLNWFKAKGEISSGAVESMNLKAKLAMRKAFGFRNLNCLQMSYIMSLASYLNLSVSTDSADAAQKTEGIFASGNSTFAKIP